MTIIPKALLAALLFTASTTSVAALSPAEQKMTKTVDAEYERAVALLEKLVNQNSGSLNIEGVTKVGEMMRAELEPLGFQVSWIPMTEVKRAGHIVAVHKGNGKGKRMLLIGHLDTVFEKDSPFQTFVRKGDKAEGPGSGDDKGGMVVMVAALRAMQEAGTLKDADIEIVLTGDEEDSGDPHSISRRDLIAAGKRADAPLDFQGMAVHSCDVRCSIARRSSISWTLKVTAKSSHSSGIFTPSAGEGAIYAASRIIAAFRDELREPNLTYNVGLIAGGTQATLDEGQIRATAAGKTNIIPSITLVRGDMRTLSDGQTDRVEARMKAIVARSYPGAQAQISFDPGYPAMAPTEGNRALLNKLNEVNADLGLKAMPALDPLKRGAGDIAFVAKDVDGLVGLGTDSDGDHAPGETVNLDSIHRQAKRAAILMTRLSKEAR
jgi:glutamate carboxypeptidase